MFGSTVLEVAIGLTFCFASVSLIVSTLVEGLASMFRLRARTLLSGVKTMLNDPNFEQLARAIYTHALVNPHDDGSASDPREMAFKPSYIDARHFAMALADSLSSIPGDYAQLGRDIEQIADPQLRRVLRGIYRRAGDDAAQFQAGVASWFDNAMERISGAYKRRSQLIAVLITMLLAILLNIDSIHLFRTLWQHPALAAHVGTIPASLDMRTIDALWTLPIGWQSFPPAVDSNLLLKFAGWSLTASSALFGAPFWFDLLQKLVQVRGTGDKPREHRPPAQAQPERRHHSR